MEWIVITPPEFLDDEARHIATLFQAGVDRVHLRKPDGTAADIVRLLEQIPQRWHDRIVLHDHHELCARYALGGVHLNGRNPVPPTERCGTLSRSCHSLQEVADNRDRCDYLFLSPIFDSVSKQGYTSAFTSEQLQEARRQGTIDRKVYALGGVTLEHIPTVRALGFGGAVMLGEVWNHLRQSETAAQQYLSKVEPLIHQ